jgi:hypothetical protein
MVSLIAFFWIFVILFAIIGALRGWAKELMVAFSVILGIFIITLLEQFFPPLQGEAIGSEARFWVRIFIVLLAVVFGYQTPNIPGISARFGRERLQDTLLGLVMGAINGYLVVGTVWYFMHAAGYPFAPHFQAPGSDDLGQAALSLVDNLPPTFLTPPWIYFAIAVAFLFVVIVFI